MPYIIRMIEEVRGLRHGDLHDARDADCRSGGASRAAGLDYYNHNLDTSPEFYGDIITTRTYQDRLDTLEHVRGAGMKVCPAASSAWASRPRIGRAC